ncbi:MAG TPA: DUF4232 domain-containing protein [Solirubrobacteraceae bacterium]|jgi:hypothetical protein|nr:DUF4232 domain-containing protein [Solirubrobacteraceae bacterium]
MRPLRFPFARLAGATAIGLAAVIIPAVALGAAAPTAGPDTVTGPGAIVAPSAVSANACAPSGLVAWLNTQGNGAAGSVFYTLEFTNVSGHTCTVGGYPGVSAVNRAGQQLGRAAARDNGNAAHVITLANGARATATLRIIEAGNFPSSTCKQVTAVGLRVFPPNLTTSTVIPFPYAACSKAGPVFLTVRAVQHG